jgi:hypothetical protein
MTLLTAETRRDGDKFSTISRAWRILGGNYYFLIGILGGGVQLGPLGTAATNGLLCQALVNMMMETLVE